MSLLVVDPDDEWYRQDGVTVLVDVEEPGHHMCALDHDARALDGRALDERVDPDRDRGGLLAVAHHERVGRARRRLANGPVRLERRDVQRRHQLGGKHRPHHLADRVGGDDPDDAETRGQLGGDRRLADAGRAADQDDDRDVEVLDALPAEVVRGVPLPRHVARNGHLPVHDNLELVHRDQRRQRRPDTDLTPRGQTDFPATLRPIYCHHHHRTVRRK